MKIIDFPSKWLILKQTDTYNRISKSWSVCTFEERLTCEFLAIHQDLLANVKNYIEYLFQSIISCNYLFLNTAEYLLVTLTIFLLKVHLKTQRKISKETCFGKHWEKVTIDDKYVNGVFHISNDVFLLQTCYISL